MNDEDLLKAKELKEEIARAEKDFDVITDPTDSKDNEEHIKRLAKELAKILTKDNQNAD